jgi:hypothetical protein
MLSDDELGAALGERLQEGVRDVSPSGDLLAALEKIADARGSRSPRSLTRRLRGRILIAVPVPVAALIAAAVLILSGSQAAPSYAVTLEPDGSVHVTINQITGVAAANARLRQLSIHTIVVVPMSATCTSHPDLSYMGVAKRPAPDVRLIPTRLPPDTTIILAAEQIGPNKVEMAFGRITGGAPPCVSSRGTGPGLGNWKPSAADRAATKPSDATS